MDVLTAEFAGAQRDFRLGLGQVADLEEACGRGVGVIYKHLALTDFEIREVRETLVQGLIGGGEKPAEARRLVDMVASTRPLLQVAGIASDVVISLMTGVQPDELSKGGSEETRLDMGAILHAMAQVGIAPEQVRAMRYADFCNLMRAAGGKSVQPPSEEEFADMLRDWEARQ